MRLLWIVNMLLPDAADYLGVKTGLSGTWMIDISHMLAEQENTELAIACIYGKEFRKFDAKGITYFCLPGNGKNMLVYTKKYEKMWNDIFTEQSIPTDYLFYALVLRFQQWYLYKEF